MKFTRILLLFAFLFVIRSSYGITADTTKNIFERGLDALKLQKANSLLASGDYENAYVEYLNFYNGNPQNPLVCFRVGECLYYMKKNSDALTYLNKANELSSDIHKDFKFVYAKAIQKSGDFDKAKSVITAYKATLKPGDKYDLDEANKVMEELEFARNLVAHPVNVTITNLGLAVNSKYDDYGAAISADGKTLVFTSRRPETKGGKRDPNDNKFLEDIYISTWNEKDNAWNSAEPIPGKINTEDHDGCLSLSPTGDEIYVYRNEGDAGNGSGDIFVAKKSPSGKWSVAKKIEKPINTTYFESSATITEDGKKMFFISERAKGLGRADIYMSEKVDKSTWSEPVNLGNIINTPNDESMVFVHPSGEVIFFASNGHKSVGGYDIYKSILVDGQWGKPENIGYPINTVDDEKNFSITSDNKKAFITSFTEQGLGGADIYEVDLSNYALVDTGLIKVSFTGVVKDEEGNVLAGCNILLKDKASNSSVNEVKTDGSGIFKLMLKPGITYRYVVSKSGYATTESSDVNTSSLEKEINKEFILKKK